MTFAVILLVIVIASVLFHFLSPWQATPLASNWQSIDTTIAMTFLITGIFFVAIVGFMAYCVYRYRAVPGRRSEYQRDNKKLEWWLIAITTLGIVILLAPGLVVYSDFVHVPKDASEFEAVGEQWRWSYRLPGEDDEFGRTSIGHMNDKNTFGIDPDDPAGQDDILVAGSQMHLPIDQPVKVNLRSKDVLHDFYVPDFRAKMDLIPGQMTYFWFTPTVLGTFDIACAEYCGIGHYNMRGQIVVDELATYQAWLSSQKTFAEVLTGGTVEGIVAQGQRLASSRGCLACHSVDGSAALGPGWLDLYGSSENLADGSQVVVDDAYLVESIVNPAAKIVEGYPAVMVAYALSGEQLDSLVAYIASLSSLAPSSDADSSSDTETSLETEASLETETSLDITTSLDLDTGSAKNTSPPTDLGPAANLKITAEIASDGVLDGMEGDLAIGERSATTYGCLACHSVDGSAGLGPTWLDLFHRQETLIDGSQVWVDADYLIQSIVHPAAQIVADYPPIMAAYALSPEELGGLVAYIASLTSNRAIADPAIPKTEE